MHIKRIAFMVLASVTAVTSIFPATLQAAYGEQEQYEYYEDYEEYQRQTTYITTSALNLRAAPTTNSTRIRTVPAGRRVQVLDFGCGAWFRVEVDGHEGYMYSEFLRPLPNGAIDVEQLDWFTSRNTLPLNTPITIMDVRTGLLYDISIFSIGNHADVVPVTAQDTATMREAFGGRWCWEPRPVLVFLGDSVIAASINGMPHGGNGGNTRNNMNGHICLHFTNSRTHNGNRSHERSHQAAVLEAYTWGAR